MKSKILLIGLLSIFAIVGHAQTPTKIEHLNLNSDKLALEGYDPVAYFKDKKAIKGKASFSTTENGVKYQFSSQANKDIFIKSPSSYKPQYGGWCAYAMGAKGEKVEVDPETFKIIDNKLYLFYNRFFNNTLDSWNKNETQLKMSADKNWNQIIK